MTVVVLVPVGNGVTVALIDELCVGETVFERLRLAVDEIEGVVVLDKDSDLLIVKLVDAVVDWVLDSDSDGLTDRLVDAVVDCVLESDGVLVFLSGHAVRSTVRETTWWIASAK